MIAVAFDNALPTFLIKALCKTWQRSEPSFTWSSEVKWWQPSTESYMWLCRLLFVRSACRALKASVFKGDGDAAESLDSSLLFWSKFSSSVDEESQSISRCLSESSNWGLCWCWSSYSSFRDRRSLRLSTDLRRISFYLSASFSEYFAKKEFSKVKLFGILKSLNIAYLADPALYPSMLKVLWSKEK